jgi:acyl-CoA synthetase (NDP forming)
MPDGNAPSNKKRLANLRRLLSPRHVAFVGGSNLAVPIKLCLANGYAGQIWPVSPKYPEIAGLKTYPTIESLPESPDATFIAVPRDLTIEIVKSLVARDAGGAVCYAAGYAEVGGEGVELQKQLVAAAGDLALVGPNCYGLINYLDSVIMFASGPGLWKAERGAAIISQSGNIALTLTFNDRSVPFSYVISAGNQAVMRISDYIEGLADDPRVTAIGLYIEGLADIPAFSRAARKALAANKPIVAFKAGCSELGAAGHEPHQFARRQRQAVRHPVRPARRHPRQLARRPHGDDQVSFGCAAGRRRPLGSVHLFRRRQPDDGGLHGRAWPDAAAVPAGAT